MAGTARSLSAWLSVYGRGNDDGSEDGWYAVFDGAATLEDGARLGERTGCDAGKLASTAARTGVWNASAVGLEPERGAAAVDARDDEAGVGVGAGLSSSDSLNDIAPDGMEDRRRGNMRQLSERELEERVYR